MTIASCITGLLRGYNATKNILARLARVAFKPTRTIGRFFLWVIVVPSYKIYRRVKKIATRFYAPHLSRHRLIHPLSRRYLIHIALIAVSSITIFTNLDPKEIKAVDSINTSIIAAIGDPSDNEITEEQAEPTPIKHISHYAAFFGLGVQPGGIDYDNGNETDIAPLVVNGGSAVMRPVTSPFELPSSTAARREIVYYTVQPGDTISTIAQQFGISSNTILWENNLTLNRILRPGDKLAILPGSGLRHKVASGETVSSIAKKYQVDTQAIIDGNALASLNDIHAGEYLFIPGGTKQAVQVVARPTTPRPAATVTNIVSQVTGSGRMLWPNACRRITQYFNWRHTGVDIACSYGSTIRAADGGTVINAQGGWNGGYGNRVIIDHGNGLQTLYGHLSAIYVTVGDTVERGQVIGAEGSTGNSTGPHLHFEVRTGSTRRNPLQYVQ